MSEDIEGEMHGPYMLRELFANMGSEPPLAYKMQEKVVALQREIADLKASQKNRELAAYEHGLGSVAEVRRQNQVLVAVIAGLTNPFCPLNVRT